MYPERQDLQILISVTDIETDIFEGLSNNSELARQIVLYLL